MHSLASRGAPRTSFLAALLLALVLVASLVSVQPAAAAPATMSVVVSAVPGSVQAMRSAVESAGGTVTAELPIIGGVAATIPSTGVAALEALPHVRSVAADYPLEPMQAPGDLAGTEVGAASNVAAIVGADAVWHQGITGNGVDVAVIDTGVAPVDGLTVAGKVVNGPDLSLDNPAEELRYLDGHGHGTAMASLIAGRDTAVGNPEETGGAAFQGLAPDARIVNVKVGAANGAVDVSQVIAAIDWVVQHRRSGGLNIRVLNLSYGTDSTQSSNVDPLSYAAEVAWRAGIVVVAATGNDGRNSQLAMPAANPYVLAVGATDHRGTVATTDDRVATFSTYATGNRRPDLLAPGVGVLGLRVPGSWLDQQHPGAVRGGRFMRGSGTSQAAAITSGAVALLLQQRPALSPDQVKEILRSSATSLQGATTTAQGGGQLNVAAAMTTPTPSTVQRHMPGSGRGLLQAARGKHTITAGGVELRGEQDIFGKAWNGRSWAGLAERGTAWNGGTWNGASWSGASWSGASWSGASWSGASWSGASWSGASWSGASWSGPVWTGASWSGASWSGASWSGASWSGASWSSAAWSGASWSGASWSGASWS